jgi:hypothetical protein
VFHRDWQLPMLEIRLQMFEILACGNPLTLQPQVQGQCIDGEQIGERRSGVQGIGHPHEVERGIQEPGQRLGVWQGTLRNR